MTTAVQITLSEMREFLRPDRGWSEPKLSFRCEEHVFDWSPFPDRPHVVIRVYSSISRFSGVSRKVGGDAIRVCAVDLKQGRGLRSSVRVHRVAGWRENLKERVLNIRADLRDAPAVQVAPPTPVHAGAAELFALFAKAQANGLQRPKLRFEAQPDQKLTVSICGPNSRTPGALNLTDGRPFGQGVWFGRVNLDGSIKQAQAWQPWVGQTLTEFAKDPVGFAKVYGKKTGRCCYCGRHLETKESVAVGYGPICAEKFGMPWGDVPAQEVA